MNLPISTTPDIDRLLGQNAPVAIGVSGGKDSCALALALREFLDVIGHTGPRILVHSDLGRVEWQDSAPTCQRLADATGMELVTVRRKAGDLMDRWLVRWRNNVERYQNLECVKLILPWSTASMRFCTSELKTAVICRDLVERFSGQEILSAVGIRAEESPNRAKAPIASPQNRLASTTFGTSGWNWNAILGWLLTEVLAFLEGCDFALHEAYWRYLSSRVSCAFCILASAADALAASSCPDNHDIYREMVCLEIHSTFSFWDTRWLGDVAPHLLTPEMREGLAQAKEKALRRQAAEARIPGYLLFTKGWPTCIPSESDARLLCAVRREVGELMGWQMHCTEPDALIVRYRELMSKARGQIISDETIFVESTPKGGRQVVMTGW